jgi:hypothetical protein
VAKAKALPWRVWRVSPLKLGLGIQAAQPMPDTKSIFFISIFDSSMALKMRPINIPWPQPGQKGVDFTPGRIYFSSALTIGNLNQDTRPSEDQRIRRSDWKKFLLDILVT